MLPAGKHRGLNSVGHRNTTKGSSRRPPRTGPSHQILRFSDQTITENNLHFLRLPCCGALCQLSGFERCPSHNSSQPLSQEAPTAQGRSNRFKARHNCSSLPD